MEIPLNARVVSGDEFCGYSRFVVIDPKCQCIAHFVVNTDALLEPLDLVLPIEWIETANNHQIQLNHTRSEVLELPQLRNLDYLGVWDPELGYYPHHTLLWPISLFKYPRGHFNIPKNEMLLEQGAEIRLANGKRIGWVDEFMADPHTGEISHLVMREGHFWHPKMVSVPVRFISSIEEDTIYLSMDEHIVEELPLLERA